MASAEQDLETIRFYVCAVPGSLQARTLVSISLRNPGYTGGDMITSGASPDGSRRTRTRTP
jgi:hypothetical protein